MFYEKLCQYVEILLGMVFWVYVLIIDVLIYEKYYILWNNGLVSLEVELCICQNNMINVISHEAFVLSLFEITKSLVIEIRLNYLIKN